MSIIQRASRVGNRSGRGFSMLEVMFALMILGIGLIAVASILPVAGVMQRETVDEVHTQQVAESVKAQVAGRGFSREQLRLRIMPSDEHVQPMPPEMLDDTAVSNANPVPWRLADRAFPGYMRNQLDASGPLEDVTDLFESRQYYWVPLVQRREDESWRVYVFVLRNEQTRGYFAYNDVDEVANPDDGYVEDDEFFWVPVVRRTPDGAIAEANEGGNVITFDDETFFPSIDLDLGTQFLDNHGVIHTVALISGNSVVLSAPIARDKEPEYIWYGVPSETGRIPTRKILRFGSEVVR